MQIGMGEKNVKISSLQLDLKNNYRPIHLRKTGEYFCKISDTYHIKVNIEDDGSVKSNGIAEVFNPNERVNHVN